MKCRVIDLKDGGFNRHRLHQYANYIAGNRPSIELFQLTHFTTRYGFDMINDEGVIAAYPKELTNINDQYMECPLVWFTATVGSYGADIIHSSIGRRCQQIYDVLHYDHPQAQYNFMADKSNYATSSPFTFCGHPCGKRYFGFRTADLIDNYCQMVSPRWNSGYESRRMGTFVYKKEVMFAVLIHPRSGNLSWNERLFFQQFPVLDQEDKGAKTVVYQQNGRFYWKPFSTSAAFAGIYRQVFCRWDQVAFAFYFPNNLIGFELDYLDCDYY